MLNYQGVLHAYPPAITRGWLENGPLKSVMFPKTRINSARGFPASHVWCPEGILYMTSWSCPHHSEFLWMYEVSAIQLLTMAHLFTDAWNRKNMYGWSVVFCNKVSFKKWTTHIWTHLSIYCNQSYELIAWPLEGAEKYGSRWIIFPMDSTTAALSWAPEGDAPTTQGIQRVCHEVVTYL